MKTINENEIEQGTSKWHAFRAEGIGGSEIAMVLGTSPYKTAHQLWEIKTGLKEDDFESNFAVEKGNRLEPKIRAMYEIESGNDAKPCLVVREDHPEFRASLDGRDAAKRVTAEFKYVGAGDKWALALEGKLPDHYYAQVQWQIFITGDIRADYVAYNDKLDKIKIVPVEPDIPYITNMVEKAGEFWGMVKTQTEPPITTADWKNIRSADLGKKIDAYKKVKLQFDLLKSEMDTLANEIKNHSAINHNRVICHGARISEITKKGAVDYKKIVMEKLPDLDTSDYMKKSSQYRSIKL